MTAPTLPQIRGAIKAKLDAIPNIGVVNDWERYAQRESELSAAYRASIDGQAQLRGWHIRRTGRRESSSFLGRYTVTHVWTIRGFMALNDSIQSEKDFDALIEAIVDAFRTDENLGGLVSTTVTQDDAGIQLEESGPLLLAGVLCHGCRLRLTTIHEQ